MRTMQQPIVLALAHATGWGRFLQRLVSDPPEAPETRGWGTPLPPLLTFGRFFHREGSAVYE